jgi:vesicle coat complex subunit
MNVIIDQLAEFVDNMVVQHDYPGFEPRSLKLGLPDSINKSSPKVFSQALKHPNVYVRLAALRWFQAKPGMGKGYEKTIASLLGDEDDWVKMEALRALERLCTQDESIIVLMAPLLQEENSEVRKTAAKALGKICAKQHKRIQLVIDGLRTASDDPEPEVRWKAQKALRLLGEYES